MTIELKCPRCGTEWIQGWHCCEGCYLDLKQQEQRKDANLNLDRPKIGTEPNQTFEYYTIVSQQLVKVKRIIGPQFQRKENEVKSRSSIPTSLDDKFNFRLDLGKK